MKNFKRYGMVVLILAAILLLSISILQYFLLTSVFHAVNGEFGIRPQSHQCIGITARAKTISWLPVGKIHVTRIARFGYDISRDDPERVYCLGQDVWFGE